jgi:hypothetical protein
MTTFASSGRVEGFHVAPLLLASDRSLAPQYGIPSRNSAAFKSLIGCDSEGSGGFLHGCLPAAKANLFLHLRRRVGFGGVAVKSGITPISGVYNLRRSLALPA